VFKTIELFITKNKTCVEWNFPEIRAVKDQKMKFQGPHLEHPVTECCTLAGTSIVIIAEKLRTQHDWN